MRVGEKEVATFLWATRSAHCRLWEAESAAMESKAVQSQEEAEAASVWVHVQSRPVSCRVEERNWEVMGSAGCWVRKLATKAAGEQEVTVWLGNRRGRVGESTGDGSARRKRAEWSAGWLDWMAEVRVPKEQLMEIQLAERMGWRAWWEAVEEIGVEGWAGLLWRTCTGRESMQGARVGVGWGGGSEGAWEGQLVVYLGKRAGSN